MSYARFGAMIGTSTIVMFGLMYLNTYALDHVWFSQTRAWLALTMGAVMAIIMLVFMLKMYVNKQANVAIIIGGVAVFAGSLACPQPGNCRQRLLHEGDDSAPLNRNHDQ